MPEARSPMAAFAQSVVNVIDGPVTWFRGKYQTITKFFYNHRFWNRKGFLKLHNITSKIVYLWFLWILESIVEPNQKKSVWYHQQFRRVPTIDQCYTDDAVCKFEADQQFRRDRLVDNEILSILRLRFEDCMMYEAPDHMKKCKPFMDTYKEAEENWFIKCE